MSSSSSGAPGGPVAPTLPPPVGLKSSSPAASTPGGLQHHPSQHPSHQQHQHQAPPPVSPLHPPAGYYSPSAPDVHHGRDSKPASRGFYDPTTDTTKERRVSVSDAATPAASWHNANANANAPPAGTPKTREPYNYSQSGEQHTPSYYNGSSHHHAHLHSIARAARLSHSHPQPGSLSPPGRQPLLASPSLRHGATANMSSTTNGAPALPPFKSDLAAPSPPKPNPPSTSTPSRAADPMSFSNILSSAEPAPKPRERTPVVEERERDHDRDRRDRELKRDSREAKPSKRELEPEDHDTEVEKDVETEPEPVRGKPREPAKKEGPQVDQGPRL
ncbi:putative DNA helicase ino80 [Fusarium falciforme]|nr:putative DNA helicase ino80 [Fusarium falciforme]